MLRVSPQTPTKEWRRRETDSHHVPVIADGLPSRFRREHPHAMRSMRFFWNVADVLVALAVKQMAGSARIGKVTLRLSSNRLETTWQILSKSIKYSWYLLMDGELKQSGGSQDIGWIGPDRLRRQSCEVGWRGAAGFGTDKIQIFLPKWRMPLQNCFAHLRAIRLNTGKLRNPWDFADLNWSKTANSLVSLSYMPCFQHLSARPLILFAHSHGCLQVCS